MRGKRRSGYGVAKFSADAVLSLLLGIVGWILFLICVIQTIATAGTASVMYGYLFIVSAVCAVWGFIFSVLFWNAEEGTLGFKRFLVLFNALLILIVGFLIVRHMM